MTIASVVASTLAMALFGCSDDGSTQSRHSDAGGGGRSGVESSTDASGESSGTVVTVATGEYGGRKIAVDSTSVYWSSGIGGAPIGAILRAPLGGGAPSTLASISAGDVVVEGAHLDWATYLYDTGALAPPEAHPGSVMTMPSSGGAWTTLATGAYAASIASDADAIYWTTFPGGSVMKVARNGGAPTMLFGSGTGFDASVDGGTALGSIAVDATAYTGPT